MLGAAIAASGSLPALAVKYTLDGNGPTSHVGRNFDVKYQTTADSIDVAAAKFASASYPFLKEVNWNSGLFLANPGKASAADWTKAIAKAIDMGAAMDGQWLQAGVLAHHNAINNMDTNLVTTPQYYEKILSTIGHMVASVPAAKTMAVYDEFGKLVDPAVPKFLMGTVKEADAQAAYKAFLEFKDVVKTFKVVDPPNGAIDSAYKTTREFPAISKKVDAAAGKLADASYPFLKEVDWNSNLAISPTGFAASPKELTQAIDKALVMGYTMEPGALKAAALAHVKAIGSMDASGVTSQKDYEALLAATGKLVAGVPTGVVMDVYNAFGKVVSPAVPPFLMSSVKAADAAAAYKGFMEFKDVVKVNQMTGAF